MFARRALIFAGVWPVICVGLLGGIALENAGHVTPADTESYHARARAAVTGVKYAIGYWNGRDEAVPSAAQQLLRPNAILSRTYVDNGLSREYPRRASLLIVQCRDTRDMSGHYPPICYVNSGDAMVGAWPRTWRLVDPATKDGMEIKGMEYAFERHQNGTTLHRDVYDFFVVPKVGIVADMNGLRKAAGSYTQRAYGAAQVQLVTEGELSRDERDEMFEQLVGPQVGVIRALLGNDER
jgi:hypothetical protein